MAISEKEDCARKVEEMKKDMEEHRTDSEEREQRGKVENAVKTARLELTIRRENRQKRIFKRDRRNQKRIKRTKKLF